MLSFILILPIFGLLYYLYHCANKVTSAQRIALGSLERLSNNLKNHHEGVGRLVAVAETIKQENPVLLSEIEDLYRRVVAASEPSSLLQLQDYFILSQELRGTSRRLVEVIKSYDGLARDEGVKLMLERLEANNNQALAMGKNYDNAVDFLNTLIRHFPYNTLARRQDIAKMPKFSEPTAEPLPDEISPVQVWVERFSAWLFPLKEAVDNTAKKPKK